MIVGADGQALSPALQNLLLQQPLLQVVSDPASPILGLPRPGSVEFNSGAPSRESMDSAKHEVKSDISGASPQSEETGKKSKKSKSKRKEPEGKLEALLQFLALVLRELRPLPAAL